MRLSVNFIGQGRYWRAGEEIEEVPVHLRRYEVAINEEKQEPAPSAAGPKPKRTGGAQALKAKHGTEALPCNRNRI